MSIWWEGKGGGGLDGVSFATICVFLDKRDRKDNGRGKIDWRVSEWICENTASTYIVPLKFRSRAVVLTDVFHRVCRSNNFRRPFLPFWGPHCAALRITLMMKVKISM